MKKGECCIVVKNRGQMRGLERDDLTSTQFDRFRNHHTRNDQKEGRSERFARGMDRTMDEMMDKTMDVKRERRVGRQCAVVACRTDSTMRHTVFGSHDVPVLLLPHPRRFDAQELHTRHERRVLLAVPLLRVEAEQRPEVVVGDLGVFSPYVCG